MLQLNYFTGTENYYKHPMAKDYVYTDGVQYLAKEAGCYWLLDAIFSHLATNRDLQKEEFISCKLKPNDAGGAVLTLDDGNNNILVTQEIPFTDFPFEDLPKDEDDDEIVLMLFFENNVLYLPSER